MEVCVYKEEKVGGFIPMDYNLKTLNVGAEYIWFNIFSIEMPTCMTTHGLYRRNITAPCNSTQTI